MSKTGSFPLGTNHVDATNLRKLRTLKNRTAKIISGFATVKGHAIILNLINGVDFYQGLLP